MRRWQKVVTASAATIGLLAAGSYGYYRYRIAKMMELVDELPSFTDPAPGVRAPGARGLGFQVGSVSLQTVQAWAKSKKLDCPNTSMRALMDQARAAKRREIEKAKASGAGVDSVAGASMIYRRSPKERNPQVRLSCEPTPSDRLEDRKRAPSEGRLLFVFDSGKHPLRHVSYARTFSPADESAAVTELQNAAAALEASYGKPTATPTQGIVVPLPLLASYEYTWIFSDLRVSAKLMNMGNGRIVFDELTEVPWPVRSDAPARTKTVAQNEVKATTQ